MLDPLLALATAAAPYVGSGVVVSLITQYVKELAGTRRLTSIALAAVVATVVNLVGVVTGWTPAFGPLAHETVLDLLTAMGIYNVACAARSESPPPEE